MPSKIRCRTKEGALRLRWEGEDYVLDSGGLDLPAGLAENIRAHVNVTVGDDGPGPSPEPERTPSDDSEDESTSRRRGSRKSSG